MYSILDSWEEILRWQIHKRRYLDRKGFCRALTIQKSVHEQHFLLSRLCSFYFQLGKYRGKTFFQKLNYWNILASDFVSSSLRNPCGSSRWDVHPDWTKRKGEEGKNYLILFFFFLHTLSLSHCFLEIPWKSAPKDFTSFKRWKFVLNFYQMWVPLAKE